MVKIVLIVLINVIMFEGLSLAVFPDRVQAMLGSVSPRVLQIAGAVELLIGVFLMTALWYGAY